MLDKVQHLVVDIGIKLNLFSSPHRERTRAKDDRTHYENESDQIRRNANVRAQAEIARISEEEENKRKALLKKHASELTRLKDTEVSKRKDWEQKCKQKFEEEWKVQEEVLRENWSKSRKEASKKNKELLVVKALLKGQFINYFKNFRWENILSQVLSRAIHL